MHGPRAVTLTALLLLIQQSSAFVVTPASTTKSLFPTTRLEAGDSNDDPTKVWYAGLADKVQNVLTNSPLNEGKKALVKSLAGSYDQPAIRAKLDGWIDDKPVLMLSFRTCPFCIKAKAILDAKSTRYHVVELNEVQDGKAIRAEMADLIGRTSVPAVWIGGNFIGGCNDGPTGGIVKLNDSGELDKMLKAVGAL
jgi:glutaredoxin 3